VALEHMTHPRTLIATLILALACALPTAANAATHNRSHKHTRTCKATRHHKQHARRCTIAHKTKPIYTHARTVQAGGPATINPVATITSILSTPCQNTQATPTSENLQVIREATFCLVNQERARNNEPPLETNEQLQRSAQGHSEEMVSENYFSHISPAGEAPLQRIQATGYIPNQQVGYTIGENIAWGTLSLVTPQAIVEAWIASPEHLANILESKYRDTGIGVDPGVPASLSEGQPGATYTQDFGAIEG
jgi:uncharacterized protein YkwD